MGVKDTKILFTFMHTQNMALALTSATNTFSCLIVMQLEINSLDNKF